jgi:hypothetical protein
MEVNYNETDAAIFAHKYISQQLKKKYNIEQIEYLLDLVIDYYNTIYDGNGNGNDIDVNIVEMTAFINKNIRNNFCRPIKYKEVKELLNADNAYMESIGLIEPEDDTDSFVREVTQMLDEYYDSLPQNIKDRYGIDDFIELLTIESDYINNADSEEIDKDEMCKYIQQNAADRDIKISIEEIKAILPV